MSNPFDHEELRNWFFEGMDASDLFPIGIGTLGSGPFDEHEFDEFLEGLGVEAFAPSADLDTLVVGREGWSDDLNRIIEARRGRELRVYSQEMLLSYIMVRDDPLLGSASVRK